ncbi:hypothetical protein JIN85_18340 [Luteolibacter pohnpeiensis]|uniref:Uncharacterized protein n=1 Tax=Luteolibacter pohnpeiensis TaxID=454153 RepID=A0A934S9N2_9BACT|nr:hypothetical protein [Luteolibacter pohnpeiensis]MBK1884383.1 hypothetical protein [Luteolibacter pohnpeiensis]
MNWLPYDCWTIDSPLDVPTLVPALKERIEPTKWFRTFWSNKHTPLEGQIHNGGFSASRVIHSRNSFLPILYGIFAPKQGGTIIQVRMMPHPVVIAFMSCWLGMAGLFALTGIIAALDGEDWMIGFISIGMFCFGAIITYSAFWAEAGKAKQIISEVFADIHKHEANKPQHPTA